MNIASRVQGATKHLRCPVLMTAATRSRLDPGIAVRRLCQARVVNIREPLELYELVTAADGSLESDLRQGYEEALMAFERQDYRESAKRLGRLLVDFPDDGPSLMLLSRAVGALVSQSPPETNVWDLPSK